MRRAILICLVILACADTVRRFLPDLLRQDLFHVDACQHVWWTYRFIDPAFFPNDPIADFMSLPIFAPPAYRALYWAGVHLMDPQVFSDLLPLLLAPIVWWLAWRLGHRVGGFLGGAASMVFMFYAETLTELSGGVARSFGLPLLMGGMLAVLERRLIGLGVIFVIGSLLYPPVVITLGLTSGIVLGWRALRSRSLPRGWVGLAILGTVAIACIGAVHFRPPPPGVGPKVTGAQARLMPEFGPAGRSSFFLPPEMWREFYFTRMRSGLDLSPEVFVVATVISLLSLLFLRHVVPPEAFVLAITSLGLFVVAHLTLFMLYLPNRQVVWSFPIFGMLWTASVTGWLVRGARVNRVAMACISRRWVQVALFVFILTKTGQSAWQCAYQTNAFLRDPAAMRYVWTSTPDFDKAIDFLRAMPKETMVIAFPADADVIPLRAQKSVLANRETAMAYYLGFYYPIAERMRGQLAAYFSDRWEEVDALADQYGARVAFVNRARFENGTTAYVFEPFSADNRERFQRNRGRFVLLNPPAERILFESGDILIVRVGQTAQLPSGR